MGMSIRAIVAGLVVAGVVGVGAINSAWEYVQVGVREGSKAIADKLPMSIEIGRLELMVEKLEQELGDSRRVKAQAALSVDKARGQVLDLKAKLDSQLKQMASIRDHLPGGCKADDACSKTNRAELESALKSRLERFERDKQALARLEDATKRLESSHAELDRKFEERLRERDVLVQRLATIRTDKATLELIGGAADTLPSSDTLDRANKLAATLEEKLQVENAIAEMPIESSLVRDVTKEDSPAFDAASEFDRLINGDKSNLASK